VPFPPKLLVLSPVSAVQRAEGLLLWLSTYSHLPVSGLDCGTDRAAFCKLLRPTVCPHALLRDASCAHEHQLAKACLRAHAPPDVGTLNRLYLRSSLAREEKLHCRPE